MKILNFGSLNIDRVYSVERFVKPHETILANRLDFFCGGKGLNQSIALARAGAQVYHMGAIGYDGAALSDMLVRSGVDITYLQTLDCPSGHAVIQVNRDGQNCIIVECGANLKVDSAYINAALDRFDTGDFLLLQNETSNVAHAIRAASERGIRVVLNPSPITGQTDEYPLHLVEYLVLNEVEGKALGKTASDDYDEIIRALSDRYPDVKIVLTVGRDGVLFHNGSERLRHGIYDLRVVDTTAAGDTFCGYFIACLAREMPARLALEYASIASSLTVTRKGAGESIPAWEEVESFRQEWESTRAARGGKAR